MPTETPDQRLDDALPIRITAASRYQEAADSTNFQSSPVRPKKRSSTAVAGTSPVQSKRTRLSSVHEAEVVDLLDNSEFDDFIDDTGVDDWMNDSDEDEDDASDHSLEPDSSNDSGEDEDDASDHSLEPDSSNDSEEDEDDASDHSLEPDFSNDSEEDELSDYTKENDVPDDIEAVEDSSQFGSENSDVWFSKNFWCGETSLPRPRALSQSSSTDSESSSEGEAVDLVQEPESKPDGNLDLADIVLIKDKKLQRRMLERMLLVNVDNTVLYSRKVVKHIPAALSASKPAHGVGSVAQWNRLRHQAQKTWLGGQTFVFHRFDDTYRFEGALHKIGQRVENRTVDQTLARFVRHVKVYAVDAQLFTPRQLALQYNKLRARSYMHTLWFAQKQFPNAHVKVLIYEKGKVKRRKVKRWVDAFYVNAAKKRLRSSDLKK